MSTYSSSTEDSPAFAENLGGYDCEFVTALPEAFQTECPICLSILKEPCLISCLCGQKICSECVKKIKEEGKPCPLCNKTDFTFIRDYGLERYLKAQDVHCSKKKLGCQWKGKLGDFEQHLNENPSPEKQLTGCEFLKVQCKHGCGEWYERRFVATHQNGECPQRPYSCKYCKKYDSTFEDVTKIHYSECGKYPIACPNKCRDDPFEQSEIDDHLNDKCPLTEVSCLFAYSGCEVKLPRKDMPGHTADISVHFPLLVSLTREIDQKQRAMERQFEEKLKATEDQYKVLVEKQRTTEVKNLTLDSKLKATETQNQVLAEKINVTENRLAVLEDTQQMKSALGKFPIDFQVTYESKDIFLPPFLTHPHGYRMCINVCPNGSGAGEGTHVSVFTCLMRGPYDSQLKWPFRGKVTIQIVNQVGDHHHVQKTITYDDETDDDCAGRVTDKQRSASLGEPEFLAHTDLGYKYFRKTRYLKHNIIIVRVVTIYSCVL